MQPELRVMSQAFMDRAERVQVSNDPDEACAQVVQRMCQHVQDAVRHPQFQQFARGAVQGATDPQEIAARAWLWCKSHLKFVHHSKLMRWYLGVQDGYQLLIGPTVIVAGLHSPDADIRQRSVRGDCAVYTMMLAAILRACGVRFEIVTLAVDRQQPDVYSHVFVYAVLPDGRRLPLDASHGDYPGWHVPQPAIFRTQVWSESGSPVADRRSRFDGLHGFVRAPLHRGRRGLGQDPSDGAGISNTITDWPTGQLDRDASAGGGVPWGSIIGNLANQWTQIGSRVLAPSTTYTRNADGSLSYVTPGSGAIPGALTAASLTSSVATSPLIWIGGGLAALFLVSSMMGKR